MHHLRFRQIHLDFHTSPEIPGIGARFDRKRWQETLKRANVNSITIFAKCHHGWSYHPTKVGQPHPHLNMDLLKAQYEACKEIDVNAPIYISAGVDNVVSQTHPEWREINIHGQYSGWSCEPLKPGFHKMCFHSPYLEYLCEQIHEVVELYPHCDGIFLDIISQNHSYSVWGMQYMREHGLNPESPEDHARACKAGLLRYYEMTTQACRVTNPDMPVFHNSGHITRGQRDILPFFSHLELESLPTGGWGYDHFPVSAKYVKHLGLDFLGMTGKFHTTWGEFGGFKHPNALRYECAAMLAFGSKCSVGDQLHPEGLLDESTYAVIGAAYEEVARKEAWCDHVESVADIGMISSEASRYIRGEAKAGRQSDADDGCSRILLEGHFLFDVIDEEMDLSRYRMLVLPDEVVITPALEAKLNAYLKGGGKLFLTGSSGLRPDGSPAFDLGAELGEVSPFSPDFVLPAEGLRPELIDSPMVMYRPGRRLTVKAGRSLGDVYDPYFNRAWNHFCSHQHTPPRPEASGFAAGVEHGPVAYWAHPLFSLYADYGAVPYQQLLVNALRRHLGKPTVSIEGLPSTGRVTLMRQPGEKRHVLHLLYANTVSRGGGSGRPKAIEVIQELAPLRDVKVSLHLPGAAGTGLTFEPDGQPVASTGSDGAVSFAVPEFACHQMVAIPDA